MASNNQGIMHLAHKKGGFPVCRNRRAIMSTDAEQFAKEGIFQCKKCAAVLARWQAKKAREAA